MKITNRWLILLMGILVASGLSGCLEEKEELYDIVGPVATIPVFTASKTAPEAGETITLSLRYYSPNAEVKELRLNETVAGGEKRQVTTKPISGFNTANSYVDTFDYTVPADAAGKSVVLEAVAVTANDLTGSRTVALNVAP